MSLERYPFPSWKEKSRHHKITGILKGRWKRLKGDKKGKSSPTLQLAWIYETICRQRKNGSFLYGDLGISLPHQWHHTRGLLFECENCFGGKKIFYKGVFASEVSSMSYDDKRKTEKQNCCEDNSLDAIVTSQHVK